MSVSMSASQEPESSQPFFSSGLYSPYPQIFQQPSPDLYALRQSFYGASAPSSQQGDANPYEAFAPAHSNKQLFNCFRCAWSISLTAGTSVCCLFFLALDFFLFWVLYYGFELPPTVEDGVTWVVVSLAVSVLSVFALSAFAVLVFCAFSALYILFEACFEGCFDCCTLETDAVSKKSRKKTASTIMREV